MAHSKIPLYLLGAACAGAILGLSFAAAYAEEPAPIPAPVQWEVTVTVTIDGREVDVRHYGTGGHAMRFPSYEACTEFRKTDPVYLESLGNLADFIDAIAVKHPTVSGKVACVVVGEDV